MVRNLGILVLMIVIIAVSFYIYTPLGVCSILAMLWWGEHLLGLNENR